jgi:hypothetical protein
MTNLFQIEKQTKQKTEQDKMTTLKIHFSNENIRKIPLTSQLSSFDAFHELLTQNYQRYLIGDFLIQYVDEDEDIISVSSQLEWEEMLNSSTTHQISIFVKVTQPTRCTTQQRRCPRGFGFPFQGRCTRGETTEQPSVFGFPFGGISFFPRFFNQASERSKPTDGNHCQLRGKSLLLAPQSVEYDEHW